MVQVRVAPVALHVSCVKLEISSSDRWKARRQKSGLLKALRGFGTGLLDLFCRCSNNNNSLLITIIWQKTV